MIMKKPTIEEIAEYCKERGNNIDPVQFWHYYESVGWKVGKKTMVSWKSCVITWEKNTTHPGVVSKRIVRAKKKKRDLRELPRKVIPNSPEIEEINKRIRETGNSLARAKGHDRGDIKRKYNELRRQKIILIEKQTKLSNFITKKEEVK